MSQVSTTPILALDLDIPGKAWHTDSAFLKYRQWLENKLGSHSRFEHSLGVCETSVRLAVDFGLSQADIQKAAVAGLLHDAAKLMPPAQLFAYAKDFGLALDGWDVASPQTLHPFIGAELVQKELGITDIDILNAIRYHTTGRMTMSTLEKIVYIADKTENRTRNPDYITLVCHDLDATRPDSLDKTVLNILDETLRYLRDQKLAIHPRTLETRNDIVKELTISK